MDTLPFNECHFCDFLLLMSFLRHKLQKVLLLTIDHLKTTSILVRKILSYDYT